MVAKRKQVRTERRDKAKAQAAAAAAVAEPAEPASSSASDEGEGHVSFAVDAEAHQASVVAADEPDSGDDLWIRRDRGSDSDDDDDGDRDRHARGFSQSAVSVLMALVGILVGLTIAQNLPGASGMSVATRAARYQQRHRRRRQQRVRRWRQRKQFHRWQRGYR